MGVMASFMFKILVALFLFQRANIVGGLTCYMCPQTDGQTPADANIECLSLGWELSCAPEEDRCYSTVITEASRVEKGCTQSENCVGATSCCQDDFCNADPQNSLTGYGKACADLSTCIQGPDVMRCARRSPQDVTKKCLCTDSSYRRGATCKHKSYPDEPCTHTDECLDVNSTCIRGRCLCDPGRYSNGTICDDQKRLGDNCTMHKECGGENTACNGQTCTCWFGFLAINGTDSCSGTTSQKRVNTLTYMGIAAICLVTLRCDIFAWNL